MPDNPRTPLGRIADRLRSTGTRLKTLDPDSDYGKATRRRVRMGAWIALVIGGAIMAYGLYLFSTGAAR